MIRLTILLLIALALSGCDSLLRSEKPLSRREALSNVGVPLPESAHNIYFLSFAGGMQDLERFVRFDLAPEDIAGAVKAIIDFGITVSGKELPYNSRSLSAADFASPRKDWMPVNWWNLHDITQGYYRGEDVSYGVHIWVDTQRSRVYVYQND